MITLFFYLLYALAVSAVMARRGVWSPAVATMKGSGRRVTRLVVIGATGGTGRELVSQALDRGYEVTAFVRDPAKLTLTHPRLKIVRGNVLEAVSVEAAVAGQDAVVSALGHRRLFVPSRVQSDGTRNVLRAMETHGVRRFVCETSLGLGSSVGKMGLLSTFLVLPLILVIYFWDKSRQEQIVGESSLEWVIVRPGVLTNGAKRGKYRHGMEVGSYFWMSRIGRADVADFMLNQVSDDQYLQTAPGLSW
jgi:putative NADH-flavin reductase